MLLNQTTGVRQNPDTQGLQVLAGDNTKMLRELLGVLQRLGNAIQPQPEMNSKGEPRPIMGLIGEMQEQRQLIGASLEVASQILGKF